MEGKIPYTFHLSIGRLVYRRELVESAMRDIEQDSCLQFVNITDFMMDYMVNHTAKRNSNDFFKLRDPPPLYPDYL